MLGEYAPFFNFKHCRIAYRYKSLRAFWSVINIEISLLLSFSAPVALLMFSAFPVISILMSRTRRDVHKSPTRDRSTLKKTVNDYAKPSRVFLPNVLARWPWPRRIHPDYVVVKKEADAWVTSLKAFNPKAQDAFNHCDFSKGLAFSSRLHTDFVP